MMNLNAWKEGSSSFFAPRSAQGFMQADFSVACGSSCGAGDDKKTAACGSSCGAGDDKKTAACGSSCGASDDK
jgi:ACGX-repeat protein